MLICLNFDELQPQETNAWNTILPLSKKKAPVIMSYTNNGQTLYITIYIQIFHIISHAL